jgi:hypothetical protein
LRFERCTATRSVASACRRVGVSLEAVGRCNPTDEMYYLELGLVGLGDGVCAHVGSAFSDVTEGWWAPATLISPAPNAV